MLVRETFDRQVESGQLALALWKAASVETDAQPFLHVIIVSQVGSSVHGWVLVPALAGLVSRASGWSLMPGRC